MTGHRLEVADIFHAHENQFLQHWGHVISDQQRKVLRDIGRPNTASKVSYTASWEALFVGSWSHHFTANCAVCIRISRTLPKGSGGLPVFTILATSDSVSVCFWMPKF